MCLCVTWVKQFVTFFRHRTTNKEFHLSNKLQVSRIFHGLALTEFLKYLYPFSKWTFQQDYLRFMLFAPGTRQPWSTVPTREKRRWNGYIVFTGPGNSLQDSVTASEPWKEERARASGKKVSLSLRQYLCVTEIIEREKWKGGCLRNGNERKRMQDRKCLGC